MIGTEVVSSGNGLESVCVFVRGGCCAGAEFAAGFWPPPAGGFWLLVAGWYPAGSSCPEPEALPLSGACAQRGSDAAAKQATIKATPKSDFIQIPQTIGRNCGRKCYQGRFIEARCGPS
jgi:hypothetical protein